MDENELEPWTIDEMIETQSLHHHECRCPACLTARELRWLERDAYRYAKFSGGYELVEALNVAAAVPGCRKRIISDLLSERAAAQVASMLHMSTTERARFMMAERAPWDREPWTGGEKPWTGDERELRMAAEFGTTVPIEPIGDDPLLTRKRGVRLRERGTGRPATVHGVEDHGSDGSEVLQGLIERGLVVPIPPEVTPD